MVLEYRQKQREEKERRRQEEQERNAIYAAIMQVQYGVEIVRHSSNLSSTPPDKENREHNRGGVAQDEEFSNEWWQRVKYYAQLVAQKVEDGVEQVKQVLSTLTSDERWGVMLEFEEVCPDEFAQLVASVPDWVEWMG